MRWSPLVTGVVFALAAATLIAALTAEGGGSKERSEGGPAVDGLRLRLAAQKTSYAHTAPLELSLFLDNRGQRTWRVLRRATHGEVGLTAKNAQGEYLCRPPPPGPPLPPTESDLHRLGPGSTTELPDLEWLGFLNGEITQGRALKGRFTIFATYHPKNWERQLLALDKAAWVGALRSNEIEIEYR